jgi:Ulp1 family protease
MKRFSVVLLACCVASHWVLIKIDKTSRRSSYYDSIGGYFIHVKAKVDQIILHHKESLCGPGGSPDDFQHVSILCQKQ